MCDRGRDNKQPTTTKKQNKQTNEQKTKQNKYLVGKRFRSLIVLNK